MVTKHEIHIIRDVNGSTDKVITTSEELIGSGVAPDISDEFRAPMSYIRQRQQSGVAVKYESSNLVS